MSDQPQVPTAAEASGLDFEHLDFEAAQAQLEQVVNELESGQVPLDRALALYQQGLALRDVCRRRLAAAEGLLERLVERADGSLAIEEAD